MRRSILLFVAAATFAACQPTQPERPPEPLKIGRIETSAEPIEEGKPLPQFLQHFATGTTVVYSYVWIQNSESMTGSFTVRMRWHYPNDLRPPIASRDIGVEPGQAIAQFSLHNENGLDAGPYQLLAYAGKSASELTASGSTRFFVGMTAEEAVEFLEEEAAFIAARDAVRQTQAKEERARREEELKREEEAGESEAEGVAPSAGETVLPPSLTDGVPDE